MRACEHASKEGAHASKDRWKAGVFGARLLACAFFAAAVPAAAAPQRVVSLNPCLDAILVHVADRSQIAALSHYARDRHSSPIADIAATYPVVHEAAEEVIVLAPDLVLAGYHNSPATRNALNRLGVHVETFLVPETVDDSIAQIRTVAGLIGRQARGEELVAEVQAALAAARPQDARRPTALVFQLNGMTPGAGTLAHEMLERAGFVNAAGKYGMDKWQNVALEHVIADPPQVLLVGQVEPGAPTWADRVLSHPAIAHMASAVSISPFPERLLYCGGPVLIETAAALSHARRALQP